MEIGKETEVNVAQPLNALLATLVTEYVSPSTMIFSGILTHPE